MLSSELVRSVLDSAPDAMIIIDASGHIVFANRQVTALFGHEREAIVGQPVEILLPERFRSRHIAHREGYSRNVRVRPMGIGLELFGTRADGTEFPVEISLSPVEQDGQNLVAAAIRDVSERKRVEAELREARLEAERANLAKSRFLATASHDLRQPLQTLTLLNGALQRMVRDPETLEVLEQQDAAIDAMSRLINALLDISKLESGAIKLDLTDFALEPLFEELRRDFSGLAARKNLKVTFDACGARVHSDPALLGQLLRNLLSNAIKYTTAGSVTVSCSHDEDRWRIEVRDTGVGISPEQMPLIFDEFYQVGVSPNATRDGYGLGLSIVRRVVKLLDLPIHVESEPGKGSTFAIELHDAAAAGVASKPVEAENPTLTRDPASVRILLVEDDAHVRAAMHTLLSLEGYKVIAAATSVEAEEHLRSGTRFDLLITDFHLENHRTGTQVIAAAREFSDPDIGAILVTGDTSSAVREMKANDSLRIASKPINSRELLGLVRTLLQR